MDDFEIPGEYRNLDLLYLEEIQNEKEETHNEVTGTIHSQIPKFSSKARASLFRGQVQQAEHPQSDEKGNSSSR